MLATVAFIGWALPFAVSEIRIKLVATTGNVTAVDDADVTVRDTTKVWAHKLTAEDLNVCFPEGKFVSNSGAPAPVQSDQYIAMPFPHGGQISILDAAEFEAEYTASTKMTGAVSQIEMLRTWGAILRREGAVYSKSSLVHAKHTTEDGVIDTVVDGNVEARRPFQKGDYIIVGSRGGKYPMRESQFVDRYITDRPEPATDPKLVRSGFKSYAARGKVWMHKLTPDEVATHFPMGRFFGKWGGLVEVSAHDVLVLPYPSGGEIYSMGASLFSSTYQLDPQLPNGEKMLAQWAEVIQNKMVYDRKTSAQDLKGTGIEVIIDPSPITVTEIELDVQ